MVDLGWRYDARDGRYKLLDVNPRIGGTFRLFVASNGMDVARALYLDLTGQPVPAAAARDGRKWLVEPNDLQASLLYWREGALTPGQWLGSLRGVEEAAWFARDDLAPFLAMCRSAATMAAAKAARSRHGRGGPPPAGCGRPAGGDASHPATGRQRLVTACFQTHARYWEDIYDGSDVTSRIYQHRRALALDWVDRLGLPDGAPVLEVGAGAGLTAVALAERGYQVTAVDTTAAMVDTVRRRAAEAAVSSRLRLALGDAHRLPFADGAFRLVVALGVIPWLHSPERAAQEMARVLTPGGYLVVSADNRARLTDLLDPRHNPAAAPAAPGGQVGPGGQRPVADPRPRRAGHLPPAGGARPHPGRRRPGAGRRGDLRLRTVHPARPAGAARPDRRPGRRLAAEPGRPGHARAARGRRPAPGRRPQAGPVPRRTGSRDVMALRRLPVRVRSRPAYTSVVFVFVSNGRSVGQRARPAGLPQDKPAAVPGAGLGGRHVLGRPAGRP